MDIFKVFSNNKGYYKIKTKDFIYWLVLYSFCKSCLEELCGCRKALKHSKIGFATQVAHSYTFFYLNFKSNLSTISMLSILSAYFLCLNVLRAGLWPFDFPFFPLIKEIFILENFLLSLNNFGNK